MIALRAAACAAWIAALTVGAGAGTIRGIVTGDAAHMPWRKGKRELGWCTVRLFRDDRPEALSRTDAGTGAFALEGIEPGAVELVIRRPGFRLHQLKMTVGPNPEPLRIHLEPDPDYGAIILPRTGTAATVVRGTTLCIESSAPKKADRWVVVLGRGDYTRRVEVLGAVFGAEAVWNGTRPGWRLAVRVPQDLAADLLDLGLSFADGEGRLHATVQQAAVQVLDDYPARFRLMPYCDFHLDWFVRKPGASGEVQADYFEAASLLHPLFVSLGDDIGFETDDAVAMFHHLTTHYCDVPVYLAFGNHDAGIGAEGYEFYFGPRWQYVQGDPRLDLIVSYDLYQANYQMPQEQREWVNKALARCDRYTHNKVIFLAGHLNAWKPPTPFFELPFTKETRTSFPGHSDGRVEIEFQRLFLHALSVGSMHGWGGLNYTGRVLEIEDWKRATLLPQCALPTVEFDKPNSGTAATNTATIRLTGLPAEQWTPPEKLYTGGYFCDLPKEWRGLPEIRDARLRFVMPRGRYRCSPGRILQQVDGTSGKTTAVCVAVDVTQPALRVTVSPAPPR